MFKSARWRSEKNKIKTEFKLLFHVTQVSQLNVGSLTISVVPGDVGKPTVSREKATVRDGSCRWENPVYLTVKFDRDPKTGKINERKYNFLVSTCLGKAGVLGEVSVNFAEYAEASKPSSISLPLKNWNLDAILHVRIQRLQANVDRKVDECEDPNVNSDDRSLNTYLSNGDSDDGNRNDGTADSSIDNSSQNVVLNGNGRASSGSDLTLSSCGSSSGLDSPRELEMKSNKFHLDPPGFLSSLSHSSLVHKSTAYVSATAHEENQRSRWDWSLGSESDHGLKNTNELADSTSPKEKPADAEIERLKAELAVLARQVNVSELELQTLRKQIVKEMKKGQDLSREIISLKEERNALKNSECEKFKALQIRVDDAKSINMLQLEGGDLQSFLEELRQELNYEKDLNTNLQLQLQKTQESNTELILVVQELELKLQNTHELSNASNNLKCKKNAKESITTVVKYEGEDDEEQKALESLVKEHDETNKTYVLEKKLIDLYGEIEMYRRDKDELEMQIEQLALDYEIVKQENHGMSYRLEQSQLQEQLKMQYECSYPTATVNELEMQIESLETELEQKSQDFSDSLTTIEELKSHIESLKEKIEQKSRELSDSLTTIKKLEPHLRSLEEELNHQARRFEADLETVTRAKVEQEQRAIRAEEALRQTRWKNANTAERLQEEFRRLSMQMSSTFDENEKMAMKALAEASELRVQRSQLQEILQNAKEELQSMRDAYEAKICELSDQLQSKTSQIEQMVSNLETKSKQLGCQKTQEEEACKSYSEEIQNLKRETGRLSKENSIHLKQAEEGNIRSQLEEMKTSLETDNLSTSVSHGSKEVANLREKLNLLEGQIKSKEISLEASTNLYLEKEKDLQNKVEELESRLEELNQVSTSQKVKENRSACETTSSDNESEETSSRKEHGGCCELSSEENLHLLSIKSEYKVSSEKDPRPLMAADREHGGNDNAILIELVSLKERNKSMENELKEMQERYSDLSLKFAEVEGERQRLVMKLRNLKNSKKT